MNFADRYQITSVKGRIYTRTMILSAAMRGPMAKLHGVSRAQVAAVIDDEQWMCRHRGEIPARVIEDALLEAAVRKL